MKEVIKKCEEKMTKNLRKSGWRVFQYPCKDVQIQIC